MLITLALMTLLNTYPRAMEVTEIDTALDKVICVDAVGYEWEYYGVEDYVVGDLVICTMYDNGTTNTIVDDEIVDVVWSGYYRENGTIKAVSERRVTNGITQGK